MPDGQPVVDANARAALQQLADVVQPPPVPWVPQTWGWAVLAAVVAAACVWAWVRWRRRRAANRYRVEALAELTLLEARLADASTRGPAVAAIPPLLKRTALAAWPRPEVAALSGAAWVKFLHEHAGGTPLPPAAAALLNDAEYRSDRALAAMTAEDARVCARAARAWIETHRVSA